MFVPATSPERRRTFGLTVVAPVALAEVELHPQFVRTSAQPFREVVADKGVVVQVRVGAVDAVDLRGMARRKLLPRIQAAGACQQSLLPV